MENGCRMGYLPRRLLGLVAFVATTCAVLAWILQLPANATWGHRYQIWNDYWESPHFDVFVYGIGNSQPTAGYLVRTDDPWHAPVGIPERMLVQLRKHTDSRICDSWRSDFTLLATQENGTFVEIRLDRRTAKNWFVGPNPRIGKHAECLQFWATFVAPELAASSGDRWRNRYMASPVKRKYG